MEKNTVGSADFAEGVGGRLATPKSPSYRRSVLMVEARANRHIARYMLGSDLAYVLSAIEIGLTPRNDGVHLLRALLDLLEHVDILTTGEQVQDIIVQRESLVIERVGKSVGARLHLGRNRGESVRGYLPRMFFRDALFRQRSAHLALLRSLVTKAGETLEALAPVYHHLQHAGYTTLGEYLLSWAGNLWPSLERLEQADARLDMAPPPLTARHETQAMAEAVRRRLGFSRMAPLRQQLHVTEDQFAEPFFSMVMIEVALARLAEDLRLYMSSEFAFFDIADEHASGSSLLPQKKNPFGLQAVIGAAAVGVGRLAAQLSMNLSISEELDSVFQAGSLYQQAEDAIANTIFMAEVVQRGRFDLEELKRKAPIGFAGASEALDILVFDHGVPLRIAHHELGATVRAMVLGEPVPDLEARLNAAASEAGGIDLPALLAVLRGEIVPETALNLPGVHATYADLSEQLAAAEAAVPAQSPSEATIARLVAEARAGCT